MLSSCQFAFKSAQTTFRQPKTWINQVMNAALLQVNLSLDKLSFLICLIPRNVRFT